MEQRVLENAMRVNSNQLYYKPYRPCLEGLMDTEDIEGRYILKVGVHETRQQNEVWLDIWEKDSEVTQHVHTGACETFYMVKGDADLIVSGGIKCTLHEGDIFHCPAGLGHEFHTLGDHMAWINLFSNLHYWNIIQTELDMSANNPGLMKDVPYYRGFISSMNSQKLGPYPPVTREEEHHWVRRRGKSLLSYTVRGIELNLKVAPWETNDVNEVWELCFKKGAYVSASEPYNFWQTYIVSEGSVRCRVGDEEFAAVKDDVIQIYPHKPFALEFEEDAKLLSWGSGFKLAKALDEVVYAKRENPAAYEDPANVAALYRRYKLPAFVFEK